MSLDFSMTFRIMTSSYTVCIHTAYGHRVSRGRKRRKGIGKKEVNRHGRVRQLAQQDRQQGVQECCWSQPHNRHGYISISAYAKEYIHIEFTLNSNIELARTVFIRFYKL